MKATMTRNLTTLATAAVLSAGLFMASAVAQSNELFIIQDGSDNQLTVDQSDASDSRIGGLILDPGVGTVSIQSLPDPVLQTDTAATQTGSGNEIDVTIAGSLGQVFFSQTAPVTAPASTNSATIDVTGPASAGLLQDGLGNVADLEVVGNGAAGGIVQLGDRNKAGLSVRGADALILQNGNDNTATGLSVDAASSGFVLQQIGDGLNANGITANTNAQGVTIIQRSLLP